MDVLSEAMQGLNDKIQSRACFNELDHPIKKGDRNFDLQRQTTVMLDRVSHLITEYYFDGNKLMATIETTRTTCGMILYGLIKDRTGVGFSMRGMGELEKVGDVYDVKSPLTIICFDGVSNPSHKSAVVNFNEVTFEKRALKLGNFFLKEKDAIVALNKIKKILCKRKIKNDTKNKKKEKK
jgi:hypothetical protein